MQLNPKQRSLFPRCLPTSRMDNKPFTAWSTLFDPPKTRPKEKEPVCEERNVSLELSLSLDNMCTATTTTTDKGKEEIYYKEKFEVGESNYSNDEYKRKEHTMKKCREKSSGAFSLELSDISLELSLSVSGDNNWVSKRKSPAPAAAAAAKDEGKRGRFEVGECSNQYQKEEHNLNYNRLLKPKNIGGLSLQLQLNLGYDDTCCTSKKRERMGNPSASSSSSSSSSSTRNKRNKVDREEKGKAVVSTELRLGHDPWCIKKQLFQSDLGNMSRLMLASELVESHVFPFWNADQRTKIKQQGFPVSVWDCDTNTEHELVFKQWNKGANVLIKNWVNDFVKRRELKLGDEIGLYWDNCSSRFKFTLLNRAARD